MSEHGAGVRDAFEVEVVVFRGIAVTLAAALDEERMDPVRVIFGKSRRQVRCNACSG